MRLLLQMKVNGKRYSLWCVYGFKDIHTGKIEEVMLIKNQADLDVFKKMYGIDGEIEKEY